ncbi:MAG TPA: hypothetical protein VF637_05565 [Sphingomicrobium sp.]
MKNILLIASAAAFAIASPAAAKPGNGNGHGQHAAGHSQMSHGQMSHGKSARGVVTSDRYGRLYALSGGGCPPGLAKKGNGCMPPGQAKKMYNVGQRYNRNMGSMWGYNQVPDYLRNQYNLDQSDRYYYNNGYLYQVDPKTMLVQQVISALLR